MEVSNEAQRKQQMQLQTVALKSNSGYNPPSYTSLLPEDIQNFKRQNTPFSICALNAAADINSCSEIGRESFMESELFLKNKLMRPSLFISLFKNATVESQESIGSNSLAGQPWTSPWETNSADSTDRFVSSQMSRTPPSVAFKQLLLLLLLRQLQEGKKKLHRHMLLQDGERDSTFFAGTF